MECRVQWSGGDETREGELVLSAFLLLRLSGTQHASRWSALGREACLLGRLRFAHWSLAASPVLVLAYLACSRLFRLPLSPPLLDVPPSVFFAFFPLKLGRSL